jgi:hypothetical protein
METLGVSERFACRIFGQHRSTQRKIAKQPDDETALTADIIALATRYGRYGYRRVTALLREAGWISPGNAASFFCLSLLLNAASFLIAACWASIAFALASARDPLANGRLLSSLHR